jgi:hypothetical protein
MLTISRPRREKIFPGNSFLEFSQNKDFRTRFILDQWEFGISHTNSDWFKKFSLFVARNRSKSTSEHFFELLIDKSQKTLTKLYWSFQTKNSIFHKFQGFRSEEFFLIIVRNNP